MVISSISATNGHIFNMFLGFFFLAILVIGSEKLISRVISFARRLKVSELFIGLTIVSIGTSIPEIFTALVGSFDVLRGELPLSVVSATVVGTNIGSDIVQQSLIIGILGLFMVIPISKRVFNRDIPMLLLTSVLLFVFSIDGFLSRFDGVILLLVYAYYLHSLWVDESNSHKKIKHKVEISKIQLFKDFAVMSFWFAAILISAEEILRLSYFFVDYYQVGGSLIGVVFIGVATALPELATAITAILKRSSGISIGTLIGSNITNPALGLGLGTLLTPYLVPQAIVIFDLPVKIIMVLVLIFMVANDRKISKKESIILIAMYVVFILVRMLFFSKDVLF